MRTELNACSIQVIQGLRFSVCSFRVFREFRGHS